MGAKAWGRGYLNQPGLTAERFMPDPFSDCPGARMYRTGDRVRFRANGELEFIGRVDRQVKVHGHRIELGEVESVLSTHPEVRECVVELLERADGAPGLIAFVVPRGAPDSVAEQRWRAYLRERLPQTMVPSAILRLAALPLLPSGKVDRQTLRDVDASEERCGPEFVAPRDEFERVIAEIWRDLLGVERVGAHDDFFALGGQSLSAIQAMGRIRAALGCELPLRSLFDSPVPSELAAKARAFSLASGPFPSVEPGSAFETGEI